MPKLTAANHSKPIVGNLMLSGLLNERAQLPNRSIYSTLESQNLNLNLKGHC